MAVVITMLVIVAHCRHAKKKTGTALPVAAPVTFVA